MWFFSLLCMSSHFDSTTPYVYVLWKKFQILCAWKLQEITMLISLCLLWRIKHNSCTPPLGTTAYSSWDVKKPCLERTTCKSLVCFLRIAGENLLTTKGLLLSSAATPGLAALGPPSDVPCTHQHWVASRLSPKYHSASLHSSKLLLQHMEILILSVKSKVRHLKQINKPKLLTTYLKMPRYHCKTITMSLLQELILL